MPPYGALFRIMGRLERVPRVSGPPFFAPRLPFLPLQLPVFEPLLLEHLKVVLKRAHLQPIDHRVEELGMLRPDLVQVGDEPVAHGPRLEPGFPQHVADAVFAHVEQRGQLGPGEHHREIERFVILIVHLSDDRGVLRRERRPPPVNPALRLAETAPFDREQQAWLNGAKVAWRVVQGQLHGA